MGILDSQKMKAAVQYSVDYPKVSLRQVAKKFDVCSRGLSAARKNAGVPGRLKRWENFNWNGVEEIYSSMPLRLAAKEIGIAPPTLRKKGEEMGWKRFERDPSVEASIPESELSPYFLKWKPPAGLKEHLQELRQ